MVLDIDGMTIMLTSLRLGKIGWKITAILLLIALLTIGLVSGIVNYALDSQFMAYLYRSEDERNLQVIYSIEALFQDTGSWTDVQMQIQNLSLMMGRAVQVYDLEGRLMIDTRRGRHIQTPMRYHRGMGNMEISEDAHQTRGQIFNNGEQVGSVIVTSLSGTQGVYTKEDILFRDTINASVTIAGLIATLFAIALSVFISSRFIVPVKQLILATKAIGQGDPSQRVEIHGNDELTWLGQALNEMAENVERLETLRKKTTADISHELRTPLTSINGYIEAMKDGVLEPSPENWIIVEKEVQRLSRLVRDLQDLAKAESPVWNKEEIEINGLIKEITKGLQPLLAEKNIQIRLQLDCHLVVHGNQSSLERVLYNLLDNGLTYTLPGGEIRVSTVDLDGRIQIEVADTGIGISAEDIPYVFERFYRSDQSRTRQTGGTGIGLAIAKEVIQSHLGTITVESELTKGTTFRITLPAQRRR